MEGCKMDVNIEYLTRILKKHDYYRLYNDIEERDSSVLFMIDHGIKTIQDVAVKIKELIGEYNKNKTLDEILSLAGYCKMQDFIINECLILIDTVDIDDNNEEEIKELKKKIDYYYGLINTLKDDILGTYLKDISIPIEYKYKKEEE
jgi:hypothetical protein